MSNLNKLEFAPLNSTGVGYHKWVRDVQNHLTTQGILASIHAPNPDVIAQNVPPMAVTNNAKALIMITRHMDKSLQLDYMNEYSARNLWVALQKLFGNVYDSLLPDLEVQWPNLRFFDYKTIEVNARRITRFHELITTMCVAEKHDNIVVKNYNSQPDGTKVISESNYNDASKGGCRERNPEHKGNHLERPGPYDHSAQEGNRRNDQHNNRRCRGQRGADGHGGVAASLRCHGSRANPPQPRENPPTHNEVCFRCGASNHWAKICKAPENVAAAYKAYRIVREAHLMEYKMKISS
ncbi:uncharacterized protein LOC112171302 [Rosa chinensis]|uniref:uncharacterized protein LOC112171302 n=1 Tax=Rosa chinensis TaxID=74649 RepID=UPI000D090165|nr:uncharacterized protein LOC112171302 [Rosa chinensis]